MLFVKRYKKVDKEAFRKATGKHYNGSFYDQMPYLQLVDETTFQDVIINKKVYNPDKNDMEPVKIPHTLTLHQANKLKKMGQPIEIVTEKELEEIKKESNKLAELEAENERLKKELEKIKNKK